MLPMQLSKPGKISLLDNIDAPVQDIPQGPDAGLLAIKSEDRIELLDEDSIAPPELRAAQKSYASYLKIEASGVPGVALLLMLREQGPITTRIKIQQALKSVGAGPDTLDLLASAGALLSERERLALTTEGWRITSAFVQPPDR